MQVFFDKIGISQTSASLVQAKTEASANGEFSLNIPDKPQAGIYRLRFGMQKIPLILDGTESNITVGGDLASLNNFSYTVNGSTSASDYQAMMAKLVARQASAADVTDYVNNTANPLNAVMVSMQALGKNKSYVGVFNKAKQRLARYLSRLFLYQ